MIHRPRSTQGKSVSYEPPSINFHLGQTPPREPGVGEHRANGCEPGEGTVDASFSPHPASSLRSESDLSPPGRGDCSRQP